MPKGKGRVKKDKPAKNPKKKYKVRNWHEYNESLVRRGSLDFWVEQGIIDHWEVKIIPPARRKRGGQTEYSAQAIETSLMIGKVYHQPLRQTEGLVRAIFKQLGWNLPVPDFSTLSRRGETLRVKLPVQPKDRVVAIIDSTGLKVYGEGEWKVRQHGYSKRRSWVKMHVSIDEDGEIRAALCTDPAVDDAEGGIELLKQQANDRVEEMLGDGAYDKQKIYDLCNVGQIGVVIPPRRDARIWFHGNRAGPPHPRDDNLRLIYRLGRQRWKTSIGYHRRSKVETTMYRRKVIFGDKLRARGTGNQETEVMLTLKGLNRMLYAGRPDSYAVG